MALALRDKSKTLTSRWRGMCRLTVIPTTELGPEQDFLRVVESGGAAFVLKFFIFILLYSHESVRFLEGILVSVTMLSTLAHSLLWNMEVTKASALRPVLSDFLGFVG